jgi:hypothetical protein
MSDLHSKSVYSRQTNEDQSTTLYKSATIVNKNIIEKISSILKNWTSW